MIGLAKAPAFALCIAVIACRMGMSVSRDTRSIGMNTTSTVVQSIVAVILLDAIVGETWDRIVAASRINPLLLVGICLLYTSPSPRD